jgi:integrase
MVPERNAGWRQRLLLTTYGGDVLARRALKAGASGYMLKSMIRSDLLEAIRADAVLIGLLLGCGLRRSETVNLRLDQLQLRKSHWVIADMVGKGGRHRMQAEPQRNGQ